MHHIISDGWSIGILFKELLANYELDPGESTGAELRIQYKDYAHWQNQILRGESGERLKAYWHAKLAGELPALELPCQKSRPAVQSFNGAITRYDIDAEMFRQMRKLGHEGEGTLFMLMVTMVKVLLHRYSHQEEIIVGIPVAGREHGDLQQQIGFYVNTLVSRDTLSSAASFSEVFGNVRTSMLEAYDHQGYPFDRLVEELAVRRDQSRNPIFDVMVTLNEQLPEFELRGIKATELRSEHIISKFDLTFIFTEQPEGLELAIEYNTDLFSGPQMEGMARHLRELMKGILADQKGAIGALNLLSPEERERILIEFNRTEADYPRTENVVSLFERQAELNGDQIAVVSGNKRLSYRELNERSNQVAHYLLEQHRIKANELVGLQVERSAELVIGILGILKSGGAYLPIDPNYPPERIGYILNDSRARVVFTDQAAGEMGEARVKTSEFVLFTAANLAGFSRENPIPGRDRAPIHPEDLIYTIYTSGSTGNPKGSLVKHVSFVNLLSWYLTRLSNNAEKETFLVLTSHSFDLTQKNLFGPLLSGGRLVLLKSNYGSYHQIAELIETEQVSVINCAPNNFYPLLDEKLQVNNGYSFQWLRWVILGGESIQVAPLAKWRRTRAGGIRWMNSYGPTECTDVTHFFVVDNLNDYLGQPIPIGQGIPNVKTYILNESGAPMPVGVPGEIWIGGECVGRGYLNNPQLTTEKFTENPFQPGERLYRTGDLGRWRPEGTIEYIGRKDNQVKVRGYRIELGEIESQLNTCPGIHQAAVIVVETEGGVKELAAYYTGAPAVTEKGLRETLGQRLPDYMIPTYWVSLPELPLTPNGKIDRKALLAIKLEPVEREYRAPRTQLEKELAEIWAGVLKTGAGGNRG